MPPTVELLIVLLLTIANGLFVMSEMAIVSARKVRLQQMANQGDAKAKAAFDLASEPNNFLAIGQVAITLIAIISGAFGEAAISRRVEPILESIPFLRPYTQPLSFGISVILLAYLTLIIGELVPKRLALNYPERVSIVVAIPMSFLARVASPIVFLLGVSTDVVLRVLGIRPSGEPTVTEEEIRVMIEQGTEAGMFEQAEEDIMKRVFRLGDRRV
ncbi:MAG: CNNM domain-containing protein, partial [Phormidesmis sp. CAN_BIN44]|nr:CNNM domain-containing protein [Phormidesmis sp. CAN_BIN44]